MKTKLNQIFKVFFTLIVLFSFLIIPDNLNLASAQEIQPNSGAEKMDFRFKDTNIRRIISAISSKAYRQGKKINIVYSPQVTGQVTVDLENIDWHTALEAVLAAASGEETRYSYREIAEDIILVATVEELAKREEAPDTDPMIYKLKYLNAIEAKKVIEPHLTSYGSVSIVEKELRRTWKSRGGYQVKEEVEKGGDEQSKGVAMPQTKFLVINDTRPNLAKITQILEEIDIIPKQILIETRIMEVNNNKLKDVGFDFGTGPQGVSGSPSNIFFNKANTEAGKGSILSGDVVPAAFSPESADISGISPYKAGLEFAFSKLTGAEFEAVLHALEEDVETNTLSAPRVVTLDGQEAYIMIGEKRPIIKSDIQSSQDSVGISKKLDYYQNLGIELNVIPYISGKDYVNLAIYPSVTSSSQNISATSQIGDTTSTDTYPIIKVRETQTQILLKDGGTVAIGGLLKDVKSESIIKVPFLGDIPLLGLLFQRKTNDTEKINLIIFLTVHILEEDKKIAGDFMDQDEILLKFEKKEEKNKK